MGHLKLSPVHSHLLHSPTKLISSVISTIKTVAAETLLLADIISVMYITEKNSVSFCLILATLNFIIARMIISSFFYIIYNLNNFKHLFHQEKGIIL